MDDSLIQGEVKEKAEFAKIKPCRIPGYWHHAEGTPLVGGAPSVDSNERVLLMLHGGAYIGQSAHPYDTTQLITRDVLHHLPKEARFKRALALEYRLSKDVPVVEVPENPFPAALMDALAAYRYLIEDVRLAPHNIFLIGDSAGGNLALALTRYLKTTGVFLLPGGLILLSPWTDLGESHMGPSATRSTNIHSDFLGPPEHLDKSLCYATGAFTSAYGPQICEDNIFISPASLNLPEKVMKGAFEGYPKTLIISGTGEQLLDSIETLAERMQADMGKDKCTYLPVEDAFHDFLAFDWSGQDRIVCLDGIAEWVKSIPIRR